MFPSPAGVFFISSDDNDRINEYLEKGFRPLPGAFFISS